jgi:tripartite ATP-independent transporter DctP family solute receptor
MIFFSSTVRFYLIRVKQQFVTGFASFAFILQISSSHAQQPQQLYFAHTGGAGSLYELCVTEFAQRVNARLPRGYELVGVGNSGLGDDIEVLAKVKRGEVALALPSTVMSSLSDRFGVFELPFLIRDRSQVQTASKVLVDRYLQPEARRNGYRILALWENGFRHITNNIKPIKHPEDIRGMKLRVPKGPWREKLFRTLGAEPSPIAFHETYAALESGAMDGQENPLQQIASAKFAEVQRYLTFSGHVYTPAYVVVGEDAFARLPAEVQRAIAQSAAEMQGWVYETAVRLDSDLVDELDEKIQTNQLDMKAFRSATRPLYGDFIRTVDDGAKMLELLTGMADNSEVR